jgi:hypothetical protein
MCHRMPLSGLTGTICKNFQFLTKILASDLQYSLGIIEEKLGWFSGLLSKIRTEY